MKKIIKNSILNYIPDNFEIEKKVNFSRIYDFNNNKIKKGNIVYLCEREIRIKDNFALNFALQKANDFGMNLKIITPKKHFSSIQKENFINKEIEKAKDVFLKYNFDFEIVENITLEFLLKSKTSILIIDFNPILNRNWLKNVDFKIYEIDGHNIIPARFISNKQEYSAMTLRKKIYQNISNYLTEFNNFTDEKSKAEYALEDFIKNKLNNYFEFKNYPNKNVLSNLSKYLNLGFISSQRIALEVIKSDTQKENKEAFLEELITRKELADNFCLYCKNFKTSNCVPFWAKNSLKIHKFNLREYIYSLKALENAKTHDILWNSAQKELISTGKIHGYLRMYWAKKILEWTLKPEIALKYAIYLNDKYAFDAPSPNGYVGILWAIFGLHDRAFQDWQITGKIRRMTFNSLKKKFDIKDYLEKFN